MVDYSVIKNEKLRQLVMISESIASLDEAGILAMVKQIAQLPEEGQTAMINALEDEQKQIRAAKIAKGITPEKELEKVTIQAQKVAFANRSFDRVVRQEDEKAERLATDANAEDLITSL